MDEASRLRSIQDFLVIGGMIPMAVRSEARHRRMDLSWLPEAIIASLGLTASVLMSLSWALTPWVITSFNNDLPDTSLVDVADAAAVVEVEEMMLLFGIAVIAASSFVFKKVVHVDSKVGVKAGSC